MTNIYSYQARYVDLIFVVLSLLGKLKSIKWEMGWKIVKCTQSLLIFSLYQKGNNEKIKEMFSNINLPKKLE